MMLVSAAKNVRDAVDAISGRSRPLRALVVDDDSCLLQVVHQMMEVLGFSADMANGGHAAMQSLSQSRYDLMITDLQMPDMDGYALTRWLKHKSKDTKVIVMTGENHCNVINFMNTGIVDHWIFKPFSMRNLAEILGELISTGSFPPFADAKKSKPALMDQRMTAIR